MHVVTNVRENSSSYIHHDQLFKELIHTFFEEFIAAFFPELYEHIDFQFIKPLSEEVFTDLHEGKMRRLDIVVETTLKERDVVVIIHVEPQSYVQKGFPERMYHYFSLLYNKYRKPIIPIALFSYEEQQEEASYFTMDFSFFHVLTFNFFVLQLNKMNWRYFIKSNNPAAAALLSKMDYSPRERVEVKKEFLRMLTRMELDPARQRLIYGFFERYLLLNEREESELMKEISQLEDKDKIMELPISYEEKGIKKGIGKGIEKGRQLERLEVARDMLQEGLSLEVISKVTKLTKEEIKKLK